MVRALISGTKTQTRRGLPIAADLQGKIMDFVKVATDKRGRAVFEMKDKAGQHVYIPGGPHLQTPHFIPRIAVGDRLYVREHWRTFVSLNNVAPRDLLQPGKGAGIRYEADGYGLALTASGERWEGPRDDAAAFGKHRQAMHMPKWASRITLIVTDVRVERLQNCSREDAIAEGLEWVAPTFGIAGIAETWNGDPLLSYAALWDHINGPGSWQANPWIVAYSFRRIMGNIDQIEAANGPAQG